MKVILEGIDASGKTTLANKLLSTNKFDKIIHSGADDVAGIEYFLNICNEDENYILDRFHLSEEIYPLIYKRKPKLSYDDFEKINETIINNNIIYIIFVASDLSIIKERLIERKEFQFLDEIETQNRLFTMYASQFERLYTYRNFYVIDVSKKDAYEKLDAWLKDRLENDYKCTSFETYLKKYYEEEYIKEKL